MALYPFVHVSALELHTLSRYPGNRQNDRQKHQQTSVCLRCACAPRHNNCGWCSWCMWLKEIFGGCAVKWENSFSTVASTVVLIHTVLLLTSGVWQVVIRLLGTRVVHNYCDIHVFSVNLFLLLGSLVSRLNI